MNPIVFHVSVDAWKKAALMFGRTEETFNEDVNIIKQWISRQKHLPEIMEDVKIKNFLLLNKCSIEMTKQKIDMYYTIRSLIPDLYNDCNPKLPHMKNLMDTMYCFAHPKLVDEKYRVFFGRMKDSNQLAPRKMSMQIANIMEIRLHEDCMIGDILVFDLRHVTVKDLAKATPSLLAKCFAIYEKVFSMRIKAMYFINSPSYITQLITILKSVLKPKIFDRIQVCKDTQVLKKFFSEDALPEDYGGAGPCLQELNEMMKLKLAEYQNRFDELDKLRVNEDLRAEKLNNDEVVGIYGSFRKLNVD